MTKRFGFTLAEVLITLGIIGVVASMTIPTLIQDYNTRVWNTGAEVFEKKLEAALKVMNTQQTLAGYSTTEDFVDELSKHMKILKVCQNDELEDCFTNEIYGIQGAIDIATNEVETDNSSALQTSTLTNAASLGQSSWNTNTLGVQFANGVTALVAYNNVDCRQDPYSNQISGSDCLAMIYDTSGNKSPNENAKDIRSTAKVQISGVCAFKIDGTCFGAPININSYYTQAECQNLMATKSYLGLPNCSSSSSAEDYWAYAVDQCGGVDNLPTIAQLIELGKYLYEGRPINVYDGSSYINAERSSKILGIDNLDEIVMLSKNLSGDGQYGVEVIIYEGTQWMTGSRWGRSSTNRDFYTFCAKN